MPTSAASASSVLPDGAYAVEPAGSVVRFRVAHFRVQTVHGTLGGVAGTVDVEDGRLRALGTVQAATIATGTGSRDAHLRSYLFATKEFPTMELEVDAPLGRTLPATVRVKGVAVAVQLEVDGRPDALRVRFTLDRREAGLTWPAPVEAGGVAVGREVEVELTLVLRPA
jgi:polyisoprenoid-binding protein YceI